MYSQDRLDKDWVDLFVPFAVRVMRAKDAWSEFGLVMNMTKLFVRFVDRVVTHGLTGRDGRLYTPSEARARVTNVLVGELGCLGNKSAYMVSKVCDRIMANSDYNPSERCMETIAGCVSRIVTRFVEPAMLSVDGVLQAIEKMIDVIEKYLPAAKYYKDEMDRWLVEQSSSSDEDEDSSESSGDEGIRNRRAEYGAAAAASSSSHHGAASASGSGQYGAAAAASPSSHHGAASSGASGSIGEKRSRSTSKAMTRRARPLAKRRRILRDLLAADSLEDSLNRFGRLLQWEERITLGRRSERDETSAGVRRAMKASFQKMEFNSSRLLRMLRIVKLLRLWPTKANKMAFAAKEDRASLRARIERLERELTKHKRNFAVGGETYQLIDTVRFAGAAFESHIAREYDDNARIADIALHPT